MYQVEIITAKIADAVYQMNIHLPPDVERALRAAAQAEENPQGRAVLEQLLENAAIARTQSLPVCQDTGVCLVFAEVGQDAQFSDSFTEAVQQGVAQGYQHLRKSLVRDPLARTNTGDNTPAIIYTELVPGNRLRLRLLAKGGGAENKSVLHMLLPTADKKEIIEKIIEAAQKAGSAACPPLILGIGLGGTFDSAPLNAKKALLREIGSVHSDKSYAELEKEILQEVNKLNIGPAGYGGQTTALAAHILAAPCHIASLPLAVNIQCHAARHAEVVL